MNWHEAILSMIGGVGLLLYGMSLLKDNLQKVAGKKLREVLLLVTKNKLIGVALGTSITLLFQSSTATMVLLVGLTSAGIITLIETLPVILGADIGSTVTAQLIALKATELSLPIIFISSFVFLFSKTTKRKRFALIFLGFGLLFLGLKLMADTMHPLKNDPSVSAMLLKVSSYPVLDILIAAVFTFLIASSAATIGIIMLLAMQNLILLDAAIYMLLGANIGTAFTAILSSLGSSKEAQRVAMAHLLFKVTGVLLFLPFISHIGTMMQMITQSRGFQVANTHTFFNVIIATLFLPFTRQFARLLEVLVPDKSTAGVDMAPKYLDETLLSSPDFAIGMATRETVRISDLVSEMIKPIYSLFECYSQDHADKIYEKEDRVDVLSIATIKYLTQLLRHNLVKEDFGRAMGLVNVIREYEFIGDVVERNILSKAENMNIRNLEFSVSGREEIKAIHGKVLELLQIVNVALATNNTALMQKGKILYDDIIDLEFRLRMSHIARMKKGAPETEKTSFIHMDLINSYLRISEHLNQIILNLRREITGTWHEDANFQTV
ncbi:Na/Pi cotransporter family protein [Desulforamulus aquiferis]|uniref:Na/Pi cotransporter family protein n=1 Tax=Desulforamulus aquiferis TaxID=1397668 RepID=A0AAW7ZGL4_9FIRM|nr:Na/Pi cotransporter family protein [Desulforamulus aquiferis]MDO7788566.1 Na/Pi cotransporter family protein [Desulforamulus aquiferis]